MIKINFRRPIGNTASFDTFEITRDSDTLGQVHIYRPQPKRDPHITFKRGAIIRASELTTIAQRIDEHLTTY